MIALGALVALGGLACGCALQASGRGPGGQASTRQEHAIAAALHVVQTGETLWRIARQYGVSLDDLARLNHIADVTKVSAGAILRIPPPSKAANVDEDRRSATGSNEIDTHRSVAASPDADAHFELLKLCWPVEGGVVTSAYGTRNGRLHDGVDIGAPRGTRVRAAADGEVVFSDQHGSYGNLVILKHAWDVMTVYAHHEINLVHSGQKVRAGETIARVGATGRAQRPHLHFEVRRGAKPQDPLAFLPN